MQTWWGATTPRLRINILLCNYFSGAERVRTQSTSLFRQSFMLTVIVDSTTKHSELLSLNLLRSHFLSHSSLKLTHSFFFLTLFRPLWPFQHFFWPLVAQPERGPFSVPVSAQHHSHGLCLVGDSSFIPPLKPFVAGWKLADAGAIEPKLLDQYKHPSLHPGPFWAPQWAVC